MQVSMQGVWSRMFEISELPDVVLCLRLKRVLLLSQALL